MLKYYQESSNSCCLSSFLSAFHSIGKNKATTGLVIIIEESLTLKSDIFRNRIDCANDMMKDKLSQIGEQHLRYNLNKWVKKVSFDIPNDVSEIFTLVQLMGTLVNDNL